METEGKTLFDVVSNIMHTVTGSLEIPVICILLIFIAVAVITIGWIVSEFFNEHRHMNVELPKLMDDIRSKEDSIENIINESGLLKTQKTAIIELTKHKNFTDVMLESLADELIEEEQARYDKNLKITNLLAKLGPIFGLLGTLIPLGPGIIALGQGDTYTLSTSLLTAFDTTISGLAVSVVAIIVSAIRNSWYSKYMSIIETLMDCVLEMEKKHE